MSWFSLEFKAGLDGADAILIMAALAEYAEQYDCQRAMKLVADMGLEFGLLENKEDEEE